MRRHNQFRKRLPFKSVQGSSGKSGLIGAAADAAGATISRARGQAAWQKTKILRRRSARAARPTSKSPRRGPTRKKIPISRPIKAFASPITRIRCGRARGPTLLEDFVLREKIFHFDHERIPERIVHARGSAAHGYFENFKSLADITKADLFQRPGEKTPLFTRISTVAGGAGSVDTPRDVRGFAVKFYTKEGNWDLVGNNIPVFFIQDAIKFPDLIHAVKME